MDVDASAFSAVPEARLPPGAENPVSPLAPASAAARAKRPRLALSVRLEPGLDAASSAHEVFVDGTYAPADRSHLARVSAAASSFVASALANPTVGSAVGGSGPPAPQADDTHPADPAAGPNARAQRHHHGNREAGVVVPSWPAEVVAPIEGALDELSRAVTVIEALRHSEPLLELVRFTRPAPVAASAAFSGGASRPSSTLPVATLRVGGAMLMAKRRALNVSADMLSQRAAAFREWTKDDSAFARACEDIRKHCGALRRAADGTPLVDIGIGHFVPIERQPLPMDSRILDVPAPGKLSASAEPTRDEESAVEMMNFTVADNLEGAASSAVSSDAAPVALEKCKSPNLSMYTPPPVSITYSVHSHFEAAGCADAAIADPADQTTGWYPVEDKKTTNALIRQIRLARMSAFRQLTFDRMIHEADRFSKTEDLTSNQLSLVSDPGYVLNIRRTVVMNGCRPDCTRKDGAEGQPVLTEGQDSLLLSIVAGRRSLRASVKADQRDGGSILDLVEKVSTSRCTLMALERALDHASEILRVRVDWSRGSSLPYEANASVYATAMDGDGPTRLLATFEPLFEGNNAGNDAYNGHVRVTPAFGVVIPAPDDPRVRNSIGKYVPPSSSPSGDVAVPGHNTFNSSVGLSLDDVPRGYVCPVVGGEIMSVITLLLCVRQLDALESAARSGTAAVLDVDRQCFTVVVLSPRTGRTLRAKVWPCGPRPGAEVPGTLVWLDEQFVDSFPEYGNGRLAEWRRLLRELVVPAAPGAGAGAVGAAAVVAAAAVAAAAPPPQPPSPPPLVGTKNEETADVAMMGVAASAMDVHLTNGQAG